MTLLGLFAINSIIIIIIISVVADVIIIVISVRQDFIATIRGMIMIDQLLILYSCTFTANIWCLPLGIEYDQAFAYLQHSCQHWHCHVLNKKIFLDCSLVPVSLIILGINLVFMHKCFFIPRAKIKYFAIISVLNS